MRIRLWLFTLVAGLGVLCGQLVQAQDAGRTVPRKRVALVVGNSAYGVKPGLLTAMPSGGFGQWPALTNPSNDADAVGTALRAAGFEVMLLKDATKASLVSGIDRFRTLAADADTALFYFAGHGFEYAGDSYIVPVDGPAVTSPGQVKNHFVELSKVYLAEGAARHALVFLDACRTREPLVQIDDRDADITVGPPDQINLPDAFDGVVFFSTSRNRVAYDSAPLDGGRNSPFARAVVDWLGNSAINLTDYFNFVRADVVRKTSGAEYAQGAQKPIPYGQFPDQSTFSLQPPSAAPAAGNPAKAARALERLTPDSIRREDGQTLVATVLREASAPDVQALADRGDPLAQYVYGSMAFLGIGMKRDAALARRYLEKGAGAGLAIAQAAYGYLLEYGGGGAADKALAAQWYARAHDQGFAKASSNLAHLLWFEAPPVQDRKRALALWEEAAAAGYPYAMYATGIFGGAHDRAAAALRAEADKGNASAANWLCQLEAGTEPWQKPETVFQPCLIAAQDNHPEAMAATAWLFRTGRGIGVSLKDAKYWAAMARSHLTPAQVELARYLSLYDGAK